MEDGIPTPNTAASADLGALRAIANRLRRHSIEATTRAGSGHPSSCLSSAEILAALFFRFLRYDLDLPENPYNDRFVLSKGHAAPLLWAALAEAGAFPVEHLETLRQIDSDLEGHPTPRSRWVDVATGSLGQGLSVALGMALAARLDATGSRVFALMGDGETAEGSVWEAAALASHYALDNLVAIVDVNRLGQSQATMCGRDIESYSRRFEAFGWHTRSIDGHNLEEVVAGLEEALAVEGRPAVLIASTIKGKGVSFMEDLDGWHGKPIPADRLQEALRELGETSTPHPSPALQPAPRKGTRLPLELDAPLPAPQYAMGEQVATRQAYGRALARLGRATSRLVVLDGDTKNSTYSQEFLKQFPERFIECFIAEQNMVGVAVGLAALGRIAFASTFACFLTRAFDQIRMAAISRSNINLCGSHAGVSIGQDGPSQMALEDLAMMRAVAGSTVLYPSDGVSAERMVELAATTPGLVYIRTTRPKTPVLYGPQEEFRIGGSKVVRSSSSDRATVVAAGITLHQALAAWEELQGEGIPIRVIDLYSVKPIDAPTLRQAAEETGLLLTVEDHYPEGGLGSAVQEILGDVSCRFRRLAVNGLPRSGPPEALMEMHGISTSRIVAAVRQCLS